MDLGLYVNTMLTASVAVPTRELKPIYRSETPMDSQMKIQILILSLKSLKCLNIRKIILNIDCDEFYSGGTEEVLDAAKAIFCDAEIVSEKTRPTNLSAWNQSAELAQDFFGPENPIICVFNHDHIFVDHVPEIFQYQINTLFKENKEVYLCYSHAPETISFLGNHQAYLYRLSKSMSFDLPVSPPQRIPDTKLFHHLSRNHIDGIFVTTAKGLKKLWGAACVRTSYAPRPDWPGVTFSGAVFNIVSTKREFFRHFDGYGHVSAIPSLQGMSLKKFDENGNLAGRRVIGDALRGGFQVPESIDHAVTAYVDLFMSVYLLLIRDSHYIEKHSPPYFSNFITHLDKSFGSFLEFQVREDLEFFNIASAKITEIVIRLSHAIYLQQLTIFGLVDRDVATMPHR